MENRRDFITGEINALKSLLNDTDYKCLKYAEGAITEQDYADTKQNRATWRTMINQLEAILDTITDDMAQLDDQTIADANSPRDESESIDSGINWSDLHY